MRVCAGYLSLHTRKSAACNPSSYHNQVPDLPQKQNVLVHEAHSRVVESLREGSRRTSYRRIRGEVVTGRDCR